MTERPFRPHPKPEPRPKGGTSSVDRPKPARVTQDVAFEIAIHALGWLAADPERLDRFLSLTGIDHGQIRSAAQEQGFLGAVLDHLCADENNLLVFAGEQNMAPERISGARDALCGPAEWQSI